jgi:SAM-dependent methyltransferase
VASEYPSDRPLVDVGAGTGRDAFWFARKQGRSVLAVDYSVNAVNRGQRLAGAKGLAATFEVANLYDARSVLALGARLSRTEEPVDLYVRFTLHDLEPVGREHLIRLASMSLRRGGYLFLEFRTPRDRHRHHEFGRHPRRYAEPADVAAEIEAAGGRVVHQVEGTGLSPLREEDPYLCRMVASWSRSDSPVEMP